MSERRPPPERQPLLPKSRTLALDAEAARARKRARCIDVGIDVTYMVVFVLLNVTVNLFNKWTFTTIGLKIPLIATTIHEAVVFVVFAVIALSCTFCCSGKKNDGEARNAGGGACGGSGRNRSGLGGWRFLPWARFANCRNATIVAGLSLVSALNYGFVAVSLMRLSHPDHQMLRALVPIFSALFFFAVERRELSVVQFAALSFTAVGAALAVSTHNSFWRVDMLGLFYCLAANVASAMQLSLIALARRELGMSAAQTILYTSLPCAILLLPFVFVTHEPHAFADFLEQQAAVTNAGPGLQGGGLAAAALVGGSLLVLLYLFVIVELIQRTSSVFSSVLSNLKIVLAIGGAELLVQNTRLPPVSWVGIVIVTVSFGVMVWGREMERKRDDDGYVQCSMCCRSGAMKRCCAAWLHCLLLPVCCKCRRNRRGSKKSKGDRKASTDARRRPISNLNGGGQGGDEHRQTERRPSRTSRLSESSSDSGTSTGETSSDEMP